MGRAPFEEGMVRHVALAVVWRTKASVWHGWDELLGKARSYFEALTRF